MVIKISFFDKSSRKLYCGGKTIYFTNKEFMMLSFLIESESIVPVEDIISHVWKGKESVIVNNNIFQLTHRIRKKLSHIGSDIIFSVSVNSGGYCKFKSNVIFLRNKLFCFLFNFMMTLPVSILRQSRWL